MTTSKLTSMADAISRWVTDGTSVAIGTTLETSIPFAAGHEIIRQGKKGLTLIGPISDMLFDQMIGAGCVKRVRAAWVGNVITGVGYNFRRAVEQRRIDVEDHSNLTISMALQAGAMGVSFLPSRTALGSDLFATNPGLKSVTCPFTRSKTRCDRGHCPGSCHCPCSTIGCSRQCPCMGQHGDYPRGLPGEPECDLNRRRNRIH